MKTNFNGTFYCCREAAKEMISSGKGSIVTVSSMWGVSGSSYESAYSSSKAAIIGLSKSLAKELGPSGIRVNCVAPGVIDTDMNAMYSDEDMKVLAEKTPLGRIGDAKEVADLVYYLASEESSFVTGQVIGCDGGFNI
jgi:3-oxoacyl-[acyl-carrier protein] reductase